MSTSFILLEQNFTANDVAIMVFEPSILSPRRSLGGIDDIVQGIALKNRNLSE